MGCVAPSDYHGVVGKRTKRGTCAVCGEYGDLSFEHVPPRSCYNDRAVEVLRGERVLDLAPGETPRGRIEQRGAGGYYSCATCNNLSGRLYVPETRRWVERGADLLRRIGDRDGQDTASFFRFVDVEFLGVTPLLFLKQVAFMFLCVNGPGFARAHPDLVRFVLNRDSQDLSEVCRFHLGLTWGPHARSVGGSAVSNLNTGGATYLSDISFAPFAYTMRIGEPYVLLSPCEITGFKSCGPNEQHDVSMRLQVGFTHLAFPGDSRSSAAIEAQRAANMRDAERHGAT